MRTYILPVVIAVLLFFSRCAQIGVLSGGEVDRIPPKPLEFLPAQKTLNFNDPILTITFDEHVQVLNAAAQLRMSPKVDELPDLTAKGKTLVVNLSKTKLQPNTTYRLEFGASIADLTEKNTVKNLEYVFSTGAAIDTLQVSGRVTLADDNSAAPEIQVGLYLVDPKRDSLVYTTTPLYSSTTDNTGAYTFRNLPSQTFKVVAIADKNKNQLYDGETERLAFLKQDLQLQHDSLINLSLFAELPSKTFLLSNSALNYGKQLLRLNREAAFVVKPLNKNQSKSIFIENSNNSNDSVFVYYTTMRDTLALVVGENENTADTVYVRIPTYRKKPLAVPELLVPSALPTPTDGIVLRFNCWMDTVATKNKSLILKKGKDTSSTFVRGNWLNIHDFKVNATLNAGTAYTLQLPKGTFSEIQGNSCDSVSLNFKTKQVADFGRLKLKLRFKSKQQYLVQLLNEQNKIVQQQKVYLTLSGSNLAELDFKGLQPGTYQVKIIYDANENEKWDTGNYLKQIQAEKVLVLQKQIKVLADWDTEEELDEK